MNDSRICTIDGPAGAGKSTVAKAVARSLGWQLLDTGAIYRALAVVAQARDVAWDAEPALAALATEMNVRFQLEGDRNRMFVTVGAAAEEEVTSKLRTPEISNGASAVSKLPTDHPHSGCECLPIQNPKTSKRKTTRGCRRLVENCGDSLVCEYSADEKLIPNQW